MTPVRFFILHLDSSPREGFIIRLLRSGNPEIPSRMEENRMLSIGQFSLACHVSVKALRHCEKVGLLLPTRVDD